MNKNSIVLYLLFLAKLFIYIYVSQYFQSLLLLFRLILYIFILVLVIIGSISYGCIQEKQIYISDTPFEQSLDVNEHRDEKEKETINKPIDEYCKFILDIPVNLSKDLSRDANKIFVKSSRELICYCDGSYSYENQIGYSGFLASNGFRQYCYCPPRHRQRGSTESEVFAACLALQYAADCHYDTLVLYTDNSKVVQLWKRPKKKDYNNYSMFFQALNECSDKNDLFHIRVEHIRGHSTWFEQQQCIKKRQFAEVDRQVRQKRRQYEKKHYLKNNGTTSIPFTYHL